jgi:hypothetical protein
MEMKEKMVIKTEIKEFNNLRDFYDWVIEQDAETNKITGIKVVVHKIEKG